MDAEKYSDSIGKKIFIKFLLEKKPPLKNHFSHPMQSRKLKFWPDQCFLFINLNQMKQEGIILQIYNSIILQFYNSIKLSLS